jgi:hypothetical protein
MAVGARDGMNMKIETPNELSEQLERFATEELLRWAHEMDYFGGESFVWDTCGSLELGKPIIAAIDQSRKGPDESLSNLSRNAGASLPGDRRGRGRRAQSC